MTVTRSHREPLVKKEDAPHWVHFQHIHDGYRYCKSWLEVIWSAVGFHHKDTLDMYTTLLSGMFAVFLLRFAFWSREELSWNGNREAFLLFWVQFGNPLLHVPASVSYHLVGHSGISLEAFEFTKALDYAMIFWSSLPLAIGLAYFPFYNNQPMFWFTVIAVILCCLNTTFTLRSPKNPKQRVKEVGTLALSYFIPVFYVLFTDVWRGHWDAQDGWGLLAFVALVLGSMFYGLHFPERLFKANYFLHVPITGHSLMHVMVMIAYTSEFMFIYHSYLRHLGEPPFIAYMAMGHFLWG